MLSSFWKFFLAALIAAMLFVPVVAEELPHPQVPHIPQVPGAIPARSPFPQRPRPLTQSSGYIFAGTVKSVERMAPKGNGVATVQVTFHVDRAMQGVQSGQLLSIREWAGLWELGERYRPGERVLLFLYPPSKLGLTSPVQGRLGRFSIGADGRVPLDPARAGSLAPRQYVNKPFSGQTSVSPVDLVRFLRSTEEE
jgi:hypothetical protein